jgi:hypothetical protein
VEENFRSLLNRSSLYILAPSLFEQGRCGRLTGLKFRHSHADQPHAGANGIVGADEIEAGLMRSRLGDERGGLSAAARDLPEIG